MIRKLSLVVWIAWVAAAHAAAAAPAQIEWKLENPFRFFLDPEVTQQHAAAFAMVGKASDPITAAERRLSSQSAGGWAEQAFRRSCWHLGRQDFSPCGGHGDYIFPRSHRVSVRLKGGPNVPGLCEWTSNPTDIGSGAWRGMNAPCTDGVAIDIPYPEGATVAVRAAGEALATVHVQINDVFIVGLGDSYASGEGNPDRPVRWNDARRASFGSLGPAMILDGYPERESTAIEYDGLRLSGPSALWLSQPCHRSLYSHQLRVALQLALEDPKRAVTFLGVACSGAEITSGLLNLSKGVETFPAHPVRSQIGDVAFAQCGGRGVEARNYASSFTDGGRVPALDGLMLERCPPERARKIDLLLMSIGGNDVGFAKLIGYAALRDHTPLRDLGKVTEQIATPQRVRLRFRELESRFKLLRRALYNHLHIRWDEADRVLLTAYPTIAVQRQGVCDSNDGFDGFPGYRLDAQRVLEAEQVATELDGLMGNTSRAFGWTYVREHRTKFIGHGLCAGSETGPTAGPDEQRLPRWTRGAWYPYPPSQYRPYAMRARWMRTSNDAFMTSHVDLSTDLRRKMLGASGYQPPELLSASTYGGAFHPTAEGQAVIADAVLPRARKILAKYAPKRDH